MAAEAESGKAKLLDWIGVQLNGQPFTAVSIAGGGETRGGLHVKCADGKSYYVNYDTRRRHDPARVAEFDRETAILRRLQSSTLPVPRLVAVNSGERAMLFEWAAGNNNYSDLTADAERQSVAFDYMRQMARLHSIEILPEDFAAPGLPRDCTDSTRLAVEALREKLGPQPTDPLLAYLLRWLECNIPKVDVEPVLVHGDAGPGNFLFAGGKVTAMLDWEMAHPGDPMEDLAWIAVRDLIQPFYDLTACYSCYCAAGGAPLDIDRIRYYRVLIQACIIADVYIPVFESDNPYDAAVGNVLNYYHLHRRTAMESILEMIDFEPSELPEPVSRRRRSDRLFEIALHQLRHDILPAIEDATAVHRAKSLARLLKYWRGLVRSVFEFESVEKEEIDTYLGVKSVDLEEARERFSLSISECPDILDRTLLELLHHHVMRDAALMKPAMGALADRHYKRFHISR